MSAHIKALQEILGHADAMPTLNTYSHLIPSDGHAAAGKMAEFLLREEDAPLYCPSPFESSEDQGAA